MIIFFTYFLNNQTLLKHISIKLLSLLDNSIVIFVYYAILLISSNIYFEENCFHFQRKKKKKCYRKAMHANNKSSWIDLSYAQLFGYLAVEHFVNFQELWYTCIPPSLLCFRNSLFKACNVGYAMAICFYTTGRKLTSPVTLQPTDGFFLHLQRLLKLPLNFFKLLKVSLQAIIISWNPIHSPTSNTPLIYIVLSPPRSHPVYCCCHRIVSAVYYQPSEIRMIY